MLQTWLLNGLIFCSILLLIVLIVGAVQLVMILIDVRRTTGTVTEKVRAVASLLGQSTMKAFAAMLNKGLEVLFKKK
jgi:hypothetical protein